MRKTTLLSVSLLLSVAACSAFAHPVAQTAEAVLHANQEAMGDFPREGTLRVQCAANVSGLDGTATYTIDLATGMYGYGKLHGYFGASTARAGYVIEGVHLRSTGYKQIDGGGGDTGFEKNEWMWKGRYLLSTDPNAFQSVGLKVGYADEDSRESYLGLSDADFRANPYRRYVSSRLDRMQWHRTQMAATYQRIERFVRRAAEVLMDADGKVHAEAAYRSPIWNMQGIASDGTNWWMAGRCPGQRVRTACIHKAQPDTEPVRWELLRFSAARLMRMAAEREAHRDRIGPLVARWVEALSRRLMEGLEIARPDVSIEEDLIEEVLRVWGYDRLPSRLPATAGAGSGPSGGRCPDRGSS